MGKTLLTDKQRKWLESLKREDMYPYHMLVKHVLEANGFYEEETQKNLNDLVKQYKDNRNGKNSINR